MQTVQERQTTRHHAHRGGRAKPPSSSVSALYRDFEKAHAAVRRAEAKRDGSARAEVPCTRALVLANDIANTLVVTSANSIPEIQLKLRVLAWQNVDLKPYSTLEELDRGRLTEAIEETIATKVLRVIQADLHRMWEGPVRKMLGAPDTGKTLGTGALEISPKAVIRLLLHDARNN